jgi:carboxyl-terminal processing protease
MRSHSRVPVWSLPLNLVLVLVATYLGLRLWYHPGRELPARDLTGFGVVYREILAQHVEPPPGTKLMEAALIGMVGCLDEHSEFVPAHAVAALDEHTTGEYDGIGALMTLDGAAPCVLFPFTDGPAARAGIRVGDRVLAVAGTTAASFPAQRVVSEFSRLLRGASDSEVSITIGRGDATLTVPVRRGPVQRPSVKWARLLEGERSLGYVHLGAFQRNSAHEIDAAIQALAATAGGPLRGVILDLRCNRGGLLEEAVRLANLFVRDGTILTSKRRGSVIVQQHDARPADCRFPEMAVVVLQNGISASASEVVAGALQDHGRARLVGTRSFGKGVVQSIFQWRGLDFRLKLTTAHYYTPNGRSIEKNHRRPEDGEAPGGLAADVEVAVDDALRARIEERLTDYEAPPEYRTEVAVLCERLGRPFPAPLDEAEDPQLAAAIAELRAMIGEPK